MRRVARQLIESSFTWLVHAEERAVHAAGAASGGGEGGGTATLNGTGGTGGGACTAVLKGCELFDWAEQIIHFQSIDHVFLLQPGDKLGLLRHVLALLAGRPLIASGVTSSPTPAVPSKRKNPEDKSLTSSVAASTGDKVLGKAGNGKARDAAAAGLLGIVNNLLCHLPPMAWRGMVEEYDIGNILFDEYLMATDPSSAPLLGWPDDLHSKDARKAGWRPLKCIAFYPDLALDPRSNTSASTYLPHAFENPNASATLSHAPNADHPTTHGGGGTGDEAACTRSSNECFSALHALVSRTHHFVESLPPPTSQTEDGKAEMLVFDPENNGLRHGQPALVGLKNRRNTCYINSMLQQLFVIPEFHEWLTAPVAHTSAPSENGSAQAVVVPLSAADKAVHVDGAGQQEGGEGKHVREQQTGADAELSDKLQELFGYLRHSKQRFFDPGEFIKTCKSLSRQPPLLDSAHNQDDTMTFLESLMDALSSIHGAKRSEFFKVVEKDRRWVEKTHEPRSITGHEKEYLMLEIEDGIGDLESAMRKHFSEELMTGDNRVWNEETQCKETVWKAPFVEETSLPEMLVVQLKRFKYNMTYDGRMEPHKLNTKVEFGNTLDMSHYVRRQINDFDARLVAAGTHIYELQGLVVHSGQTIHSGHYYSFINWGQEPHRADVAARGKAAERESLSHEAASLQPKARAATAAKGMAGSGASTPIAAGVVWDTPGLWYKLDDETVTQVSEQVVQDESFGGTLESKDQYGDIKRMDQSRSAYVLFYRKRCLVERHPAAAAHTPHVDAAPGLQATEGDGASKKKQRTQKGGKQARGDGIKHAASAGEAAVATFVPAATVEYPCCASVQEASLTAARHVLAFDPEFITWVQDVVSFAHEVTQANLKSPNSTRRQVSGNDVHRDTAQDDMPLGDTHMVGVHTPPAMSNGNSQSNKSVLMHINPQNDAQSNRNTGASGSSSSMSMSIVDRETAVERVMAAGIALPPDLMAKIVDMAVLSLAHVAARTNSFSARWSLVAGLVDKSRRLLEVSPQGSLLFLQRACARCAALGGEGVAKQHETSNGQNTSTGGQMHAQPGEDTEAVGGWRSWIEMLLLKHREEKVREGFYNLLLTAVDSCLLLDAHPSDTTLRPGTHVTPASPPQCAAGKDGMASECGNKRRKSSAPTPTHPIHPPALHSPRAGGMEGEGLHTGTVGVGRRAVEELGARLLEVVQGAVTSWLDSTMSAALANGQGGSREKECRQLHRFLLLLSDMVLEPTYLSSELVRSIGQVVLQLAIDKADTHPTLTKVLCETWVRMLGSVQHSSQFCGMVEQRAFVLGDALALHNWTWIVEWLHRCSTNVDPPCNINAESLPGASNAWFYLYLLRRRLLAKVPAAAEGVLYDPEYCMSHDLSELPDNKLKSHQLESLRQRVLRLDVDQADHEQVNGAYLYTGYLPVHHRAVYTRVLGTKTYVLMAAAEEYQCSPNEDTCQASPREHTSCRCVQRWLLAECSYAVPMSERCGLHVLHDAARLAEAFAASDPACIDNLKDTNCRILYTGNISLTPTSRAAPRLSNEADLGSSQQQKQQQMQSSTPVGNIFRVGSILETYGVVGGGGEASGGNGRGANAGGDRGGARIRPQLVTVDKIDRGAYFTTRVNTYIHTYICMYVRG